MMATLIFPTVFFEENYGLDDIGGAIQMELSTPNDNLITNKLYHVKFENVVFTKNKGAISQLCTTWETAILDSLVNCTFYDNGLLPFSKGYVAEVPDSVIYTNEIFLRNSILWEPDIPFWQLLYNGNPNDLSVYNYKLDHCLISVEECNLPGGEEACETFQNYFAIDPMFRDSAQGDLRLLSCSPFINAGVFLDDLPEFDLDGEPRIQEGQIDLGAYEAGSFGLQTDSLFDQLKCFGDTTGEINLTAVNGISPFDYVLSSNMLSSPVTNATGYFESLGAGNYYISIVDSVGCTDTLGFAVTTPPQLSFLAEVENYQSENQSGSISIDSISGGVAPYSLFLDGMELPNLLIEDLMPGTYPFQIEDNLGCVIDTIFEVLLIDQLNDLNAEVCFKLYPNPSHLGSKVIIEIDSNILTKYKNIRLNVYSANGELIDWSVFPTDQKRVELINPMTPNVYFLVLRNDEGILGIKKLIVR